MLYVGFTPIVLLTLFFITTTKMPVVLFLLYVLSALTVNRISRRRVATTDWTDTEVEVQVARVLRFRDFAHDAKFRSLLCDLL